VTIRVLHEVQGSGELAIDLDRLSSHG
jgi:hypothetical protein